MRLLIADRHALTRAGIRLALEGGVGFTVVGEADTGPKVAPLVEKTEPDVVLLDLDLPGLDGLSCLERLQTRYPSVAVIMLASDTRPALMQAAFARGARSWIVKTIVPEALGPAIANALAENVFVPYGAVQDDSETAHAAGLSSRELEIIRLVGQGFTNKQIASELWIAVQTVKFHLGNIYRKLDLANRTAAARWAHEMGLLGRDTPNPTMLALPPAT